MRTTPNDPATCWHEDIDTSVHEVRDGTGRLLRVDVDITCDDCDALLQTDHYFHHRKTI